MSDDCKHNILVGNLCADCAAVITSDKSGYIERVGNKHIKQETVIAQDRKRGQRALERKQLFLILDLDETLIHTTREPVAQTMTEYFPPNTFFRFGLTLAQQEAYFVKLRPHVHEFLEECSKIFQMYIYTNGTKPYADKIASFLDPAHKYFSDSTILSRDSFASIRRRNANAKEAQMTVKHLQGLLSCNDNMLLILDDREDVWNWSPNVVKIFPYRYFTHERLEAAFRMHLMHSQAVATEPLPTNGLPAKDSGEQSSDAPSTDCDDKSVPIQRVQIPWPPQFAEHEHHLADLLEVLKAVHANFFQFEDHEEADVKQLLDSKRRQVLNGCVICFSGLFPATTERVDVTQNTHWRLAEAYGAVCCMDLTPNVTHLVCAQPNTKKYFDAQSIPSIHVVTLVWLLDSTWGWKRCNETEYRFERRMDDKQREAWLRIPVPGIPKQPIKRQRSGSHTARNVRVKIAGSGVQDRPNTSTTDTGDDLSSSDSDFISQLESEVEQVGKLQDNNSDCCEKTGKTDKP